MLRKTILIHTRHAWRTRRTRAAAGATHGVQILSIDQMAARLAGGFLRPVDPDDLHNAVSTALLAPLGILDGIKRLPGFQRAAASTLWKVWLAGLDLNEETANTTDPAAAARFESLIALERRVLKLLPSNQLRPSDLTAAALKRARFGNAIFGPIDILGHTELPPVWRPLLFALAKYTRVTWAAGARQLPEWVRQADGIAVQTSRPENPAVSAVSCAGPHHEIVEAVRWTRRHLSEGARPDDIAIAAAFPEPWDDHMLAMVEATNLPIHFVHGHAALSTSEGQLAAALAEILLRGFSRTRMIRLVALLRLHNPQFADLPGTWWRPLPENAPLLDANRWKNEIDAIQPEDFPDGADHRALLSNLIATITKGIGDAAEIGQRLLTGRAGAIWQKALTRGPAAALDVTLAGLRVDDNREPETSVVWTPASALAAEPRPLVWLVGLTMRSWPRRAGEDPLLPDHIIPGERLNPLPVHIADGRDFESICALTSRELVCSRPRRDSEGRMCGISPLYPREVREIHLAQSRKPEHAAGVTDRLFARPAEFSKMPVARSAGTAWIDWHREQLTPHDGLMPSHHPLLLRALDRIQSASSLVKLLRDPLGYLWTYGFGWSEPRELDEPMKLDAASFGNLLHEILQECIDRLEASQKGGFARASFAGISKAVSDAAERVTASWERHFPVPPPIVWQRKIAEAMELAETALLYEEEPLPGQQSWAEIPFGGDRRARLLDDASRSDLPWDPLAPVIIDGTGIFIGGSIDRLDLSADRLKARVTDYKSGRPRSKPPQLDGGSELQRCLYAYAVKALISTRPEVEARLLYTRNPDCMLTLDQPENTLEKLAEYLTAAVASFSAGFSLPGPAAEGRWYDMAFALPGGAKESYLENKIPLAKEGLFRIAPIWEEE
ncbi:MAG: PD-(D/E)XK nuclease family protein [Desulfobacterales bacterium]